LARSANGELADQDQEARAFIQDFPLAQAGDGIVEPKPREVRIDAVAQGKAFVERGRLESPAGFKGGGVALGFHPWLHFCLLRRTPSDTARRAKNSSSSVTS